MLKRLLWLAGVLLLAPFAHANEVGAVKTAKARLHIGAERLQPHDRLGPVHLSGTVNGWRRGMSNPCFPTAANPH